MALDLPEMIELGDSDELIREIGRRSGNRDWDGLVELRDRCRAAVERGKQLWGAAAHAEYRLALEAPASYAGAVVDADPVRFALGPLPEVAASTHRWAELAPYLAEGPLRGVTAYECVARGEDLSAESDLASHAATFEMPLALQRWEPVYSVAEYRAIEARFPAPELDIITSARSETALWKEVDETEAVDALSQLVLAWTSESNGNASVLAVEGGLAHVLSALQAHDVGVTRITSQSTLAWMAWAAGSGGAHGRRSGLAHGRAKAWWALAGVAGLLDEWPVAPDELGAAAGELEWWTWDVRDLSQGWSVRLAIVDPTDDLTFAIDASDHASP